MSRRRTPVTSPAFARSTSSSIRSPRCFRSAALKPLEDLVDHGDEGAVAAPAEDDLVLAIEQRLGDAAHLQLGMRNEKVVLGNDVGQRADDFWGDLAGVCIDHHGDVLLRS